MRILMVFAFALSSTVSFANDLNVQCDINGSASARACMKDVAEAMDRHEEDNDYVVSTRKDMLISILSLVGANEEFQTVRDAYRVAAVLQHGDEHEITYFALNKGSDVTPIEVYKLNLADLGFLLQRKNKKGWSEEEIEKSLLTKPDTYMLGADMELFDIESDIQEQIEEGIAGH